MDRYNEVKILLKDWEQSFVGQHERKPNKEDIDQAPEETKKLYKEYRNLKQAKENSSINNGSNGHTEPRSTAETNTDPKESGCWGSHLNRSSRPVPSPSLTPQDRESLQASSQYYGMKLKSNLTSLTSKERPASLKKSLTPGRTPLKSWKDRQTGGQPGSPAATTASSPLTLATPAKSSPFTPRSSPFTPRRANTCPGSLAMKTLCPTEPEAPFEVFDPALMSCDEPVSSTIRDNGSNSESVSITAGKRNAPSLSWSPTKSTVTESPPGRTGALSGLKGHGESLAISQGDDQNAGTSQGDAGLLDNSHALGVLRGGESSDAFSGGREGLQGGGRPALVSRLSLLDRGWLERCQVFGEVAEGEKPVAGNREAELERIRQKREVELERIRQEREVELERTRQETRELELERIIQETREMEEEGVRGGGDTATGLGETASGGVGREEGTEGDRGRKGGKRQKKGQEESERREDGDENREVHAATSKPAPQSRRRGGKKKAMAGGEGGEGVEGGQGDVDDGALPETKGVKKKRGAKRQREGEDTEGEVAEEGGVKKRQRTSRKKKEAGSDGNTTPAGEGGKKKRRRKKGEEDEDEEEEEKKDIKPLAKAPQENLFGEVDEEDAKANKSRHIQIVRPSVVKNSDPNFVKINLKKKSHVKGYAMRGLGLRKQMVMAKFALKGERFGGGGGFGRGRGGFRGGFRGGMNRQGDSCFKCGGTGHWAMDCKGPAPPPSLSQIADTVEEEPFELPTLEEVARATGTLRSEPLVTQPTTNVVEPDQDQKVDSKQDEVLLNVIRDYERPAPPPPMEPLYSVGDDGKVQATPADVYKALNDFGYQSFRPGQEEAIMRILSGLSTLVVLSTGMGKSLCYQLPAYLYAQRSKSIVLVVSPLVSLMDDQVSGLPPGLKAACIHSNMSMKQREAAIEKVKSGEVCVLLLSPEALVGGGGSGSGCLPTAQQLPPVAFACIDEAHCVSEWSHNFRPCYLRLCKVLRERLGVRCLLGLTATATLSTALDIAHHLDINDEEGISVRSAAVPPNLVLSVSMDREKDKALVSLLKGDRFGCLDSIIVYCTRREETIRVSALLRTCLQGVLVKENIHLKPSSQTQSNPAGQKKKDMARKKIRKALKWQAESYHAGMSASERRRVQNNFMCGELRVVVATVAFGMGLDKSDVRGIVHHNMPKSFESYVQEIGRAGRDGQPAHCHLFLDPEGGDLHELRRHIHADTVDFYTVKRLVQMAFPSCKCRQIDQKQKELAKHAEDIEDSELLEMMDFCEQESSMNTPNQPQMVQSTDPGHQRDVPLPPAEEVPSPPCEEEVPRQHRGDKCKEEEEVGEKEQVVKQEHCPPSSENQGDDRAGGRHRSSDPEVESVQSSDWPRERVCHTHERAIPIHQTVEALDITEEGVETLLCYLELHPQRFVELLHPTLSVCKISCYDGPKQLQKVTKICPPVAVVLARKRMEGQRVESFNGVDFDVVEVADTMGWQLPLVKRGLRQLQYSSAGGRSGILVEFSDLSYYFRSFGDLSDDEMDRVCQFLHNRVLEQERTQLYQLTSSFKAFRSVSFSKVESCVDELDETRSIKLKNLLSDYFDKRRDRDHPLTLDEDDDDLNKYKLSDWEGQIRADIRSFLSNRSDEKFSGRAVARIFHGISSPCYPAQTYGRDRRYWRKYIQFDHNQLIRWATQEIIGFK